MDGRPSHRRKAGGDRTRRTGRLVRCTPLTGRPEQANLQRGPQEVDIIDLRQVLHRGQVLAAIRGRDGDLVEVREVVVRHAASQLSDRLVPQLVQGGVEQARGGRRNHLADVVGAAPLSHREPA